MQIVKKQQRKIEVNLNAIMRLLWRQKWLILISGVIVAVIIYASTALFVTPMYSASTTLYANNSSVPDSSTSKTTSDMNASARLVDTYAAIIMSDPVMDQVIEENGLSISGASLASRVEIEQVYNTEVFKITVTDPSPETAANIANSIAKLAPVKIMEIVDGCSIKIVSNAKVPGGKSYPDYKKASGIGFIAGVALCISAICAIAVLDTRLKGEADLYEWEYPVIGVIPSFTDAEKARVNGYGNSYKEKSKNEPVQ